MKKTLIAVILVMIFFSSSVSASGNFESKSEEFYNNQNESIDSYGSMMSAFLAVNENNTPSYYGGAYINDDGKLVVLLTDVSKNTGTILNYSDAKNLIFEEVNFSLDYLISVRDQFTKIVDSEDIVINGMVIDILSNRVVVSVESLSDDFISFIATELDMQAIIIQQSKINVIKELIELEAGLHIGTSSTVDSFTLGFSAIKGSTLGFITTGHHPAAVNGSLYHDGTPIGTVKNKVNSGPIDASWVEKNAISYTSNDTTNGKNIIGYQSTYLPIGTYICMIGKTSGTSCGEITYVDVDNPINPGVYFADYTSSGGDSGAPILVPTGASTYKIIGIHVGYMTYSDGPMEGAHRMISPYHDIAEEFGITAIYN